MIYKRCSKCGKRIPSGTECQTCRREYTAPQGVRKLYHTQRWRDTRELVLSKYAGLDLYALRKHQRIEYAETVHHIVPSSDDKDRFFSVDNLIPVSRASHDEIHARYKTEKEATQKELWEMMAVGGI